MKSISKLKDEARKHEQREEWEQAIEAYLEVLRVADEEEAEVELPLYNRLGDLCVRLGRPGEAVRHYEQAADRYAEAGLYNNAIALCNKAMRYSPDRLELIRKLGQFSALQGFITDARRYFLDYAERQLSAGHVDDALTALEDFANVADDADVREMLGRRMHAHGRTAAAVVELQRAYAMRTQAGESERANALRAELQAMDPNAIIENAPADAPARAASPAVRDLPGFMEPEPELPAAGEKETRDAAAFVADAGDSSGAIDASGIEIEGLEPAYDTRPADDTGMQDVEGLETTTFDFDAVDAGSVHDLVIMRDEASFDEADIDTLPDEPADAVFDLPLLDDDPFGDAGPAAARHTEAEPVEDAPDPGPPPLDLGTGFSFELPGGVTGSPAPSDSAGATFDLPLIPGTDDASSFTRAGAGADDDGIDLPALDGPDDFDASPSAWELDAPAFDVPTFETDASHFDLPTLDEPHTDPIFDLPTLDEPDTAIELPEIEEVDFVTDLPELAAPASAFDATERGEPAADVPDDSAAGATEPLRAGLPWEAHGPPEVSQRAHTADPAPPPEIPAIELPTWDLEPAPHDAPSETDWPAAENMPEMPDEEPGVDEPAEAATFDTVGSVGEARAAELAPAVEDLAQAEQSAAAAAREMAAAAPADAYVDLAALLAEDTAEETTRFRIEETAPTGDEDRDFAELLNQFKAKVHEHLPPEDAAAHYDLGLAFKEMGLIDEAIGEFQVALRAGHMRLRVYEELGGCFLMKKQYNIAEKVLTRALEMKFEDELELLGVYYHLGRAYEALGRRDQARDAYERVLGMDINFEDVTDRLARL